MFGALRLALAYMVVLSHLTGAEYLYHFGNYAVRAFFILSGYVITASLNEAYRFRAVPFWMNRALRLLPPYYLVCVLTLVAVTLHRPEAGEFLKFWKPVPSASDLWLNLAILPLQFPHLKFRFDPPVWSIAVEITMYLVLWLSAARRRWAAVLLLLCGLAYHGYCLAAGLSWEARYFLAPSATLSFAIGALFYFALRRTRVEILIGLVPYSLAAWLINLAVAAWTSGFEYDFGIGFYLNVVLFALIAAGMAQVRWDGWKRRLDDFCGELSYPVFLVHWLVAFLVHLVVMPEVSQGIGFTIVATPAILLAAAGLAWLNRQWIEPLRTWVRHSSHHRFEAATEPAAHGLAYAAVSVPTRPEAA